jgi:glycosyltransferase involved in cell wall biosynthesis
MNSHLFTFTNYTTERNSNFYDLYSKFDKTCLNLMGNNKLNTKISSFFIYPLIFLILTPLLFLRLIVNKNVKNYLVLFPGIFEIIFLKIFQPIFKYNITYDVFTTFHLTLVEDRKLVKEGSIFEKLLIFLDNLFFTLPDKLIFETNEMKNYLETFLKKKKKNALILTSYRELPSNLQINKINKSHKHTITFWGTFERMHGLDTIIDSAIELGSDYQFNLIGNGSYFNHIKNRIKQEKIQNVFLPGYINKYTKVEKNLFSYITSSDICLGAFSNSKKNNLVIPGKVVEAFLFEKPVITVGTKYIKNNCINSVMSIAPENSKELSRAIILLSKDEQLRNNIVKNSKEYFKSHHTKIYFKKKLSKFFNDN